MRRKEILRATPGLLAVGACLGIPGFLKARKTSQEAACLNNLRQLKPLNQFYFDSSNQRAATNQIIIIFPDGMDIPAEPGRKVELKGVVAPISLVGRPGTKGEYSNEVLSMRSWKYVAEEVIHDR